MRRRRPLRTIVAAALVALAATALHPARAASGDPPYAPELGRLAEILGSLHVLAGLCSPTPSPWRDEMLGLLAAQNPSPDLRARLADRFNLGVASFGAAYRACTDAAREAELRYRAEGEALTAAIAAAFGRAEVAPAGGAGR